MKAKRPNHSPSALIGADFYYRVVDPAGGAKTVFATRVHDAEQFRVSLVSRIADEDLREIRDGGRRPEQLRSVEVITAEEYVSARAATLRSRRPNAPPKN